MKKKLCLILLALIPLLTIITSIYYRSLENSISNFDPNYLYLCNIVSTADFKPIGVPYHPGTSLLLVGALISKVIYAIRSFTPYISNLSYAEDTLLHPEIYIDVIKTTINFITYFLLFFAGIFTWRVSKSILAGLFVQLTPIIEPYLFLNSIGILEPVLLLLPGFILLAICIVFAVNINDEDSKNIKLNAICFGIVVAFLATARLNAAPVAIIPLIIIPKFKNKLIYIALAIISGLLFLTPIWGCYKPYFVRAFGMLSHGGRYGSGKELFFNSDAFVVNLKWVLTDKFLVFALLLATIILVHFVVLKILRKKCYNKNQAKALLAVVIAQLFVIFSILRHRNHLTGYSEIWFFPGQLLISIILTLIVLNINVLFASKLWLKRIVLCLFIIIIFSTFGKYQTKGLVRRFYLITTGAGTSPEEVSKLHCGINAKLDNDFSDYSKITYHTYYSIPHNLSCGNMFAGQSLSVLLRKLYPDNYRYSKAVKQFYWFGQNLAFDKIYDKNPKIVFQGTDFKKLKHSIGLPLVKFFDSKEDVLYLLSTEFHLKKIKNIQNNNSVCIINILDAIKKNNELDINFNANITNNLPKELVFFINTLEQKDDLTKLRKTISNFKEKVNKKNKLIFDYVLHNIAPKSWQKEFNVALEYCVVNLNNIEINNSKPKNVKTYNLPVLNVPRTIKFRVNPKATTGTLISYGKKERNALCAISFNPNGNPFFWGYYADVGGNATLPLNKWSEICFTYDGEIATLYLNNQEIGRKKLELKTAKTDEIIVGEGFEGEITDLEIWNKVLIIKSNQNNNPITTKKEIQKEPKNSDWIIIND